MATLATAHAPVTNSAACRCRRHIRPIDLLCIDFARVSSPIDDRGAAPGELTPNACSHRVQPCA